MRKITLRSASIALLFAAALSGCNKNESTSKPESQNKRTPAALSTMSLSELQFYTFGEEITEDDFLKVPHDQAYEDFNYAEYALTTGLLEIYNNHPDLLEDLVQKISSTRNKCYNLFTFAQERPDVNAIFNQAVATRFPEFIGGWQEFVEQNYKYDIDYTPFVRFVNLGDVNISEQPYVVSPNEIDEEKFTSFNNNIPMWVKTDSEMLFTTLDQSRAAQIINPMLSISNGQVGDELREYTDLGHNGGGNATTDRCNFGWHLHEYLTHHYFKINERYEATGASEYTFAWVARAAYRPDLNNWDEVTKYGLIEKSVSKTEIGSLIHHERTVFGPDTYESYPALNVERCFEIAMLAAPNRQHLYKSYVVGAYEMDWYAQNKTLFYASNALGDEQEYVSHRKFYNEWYYLDPNTNRSYPFNVRNPAQHTTYYNYTKGELRLHRWNL